MRDRPGCSPAALLGIAAAEATAQIHHLDESPWCTVTDSLARRGVVLRYDQFRDQPTGWRTDRLGAILHTAVGRFGVVFVQADFLRLGHRRPFGPRALAPPSPSRYAEASIDTDWPRETIIGEFGQPEVGLLSPLGLPGLGVGHLRRSRRACPWACDELYPLIVGQPAAAPGLAPPLGGSPGGLVGAVRIGYERTFDSGRDFLTADAFPGGLRYGLELGLVAKPDGGLTLAWSARELSGGPLAPPGRPGWLPLAGATPAASARGPGARRSQRSLCHLDRGHLVAAAVAACCRRVRAGISRAKCPGALSPTPDDASFPSFPVVARGGPPRLKVPRSRADRRAVPPVAYGLIDRRCESAGFREEQPGTTPWRRS